VHPVLFEFDVWGITVSVMSYTFFLFTAVLAVGLIGLLLAAHEGVPRTSAMGVIIAAIVAALIGARLMHRLTNPGFYADEPLRVLTLSREGLSLYGGMLSAGAAGYLVCRLLGLDPWRMADLVTPGLGAGIAVCRIGCFLNGCCYGRPTELPWGVKVAPDTVDCASRTLLGSFGVAAWDGPTHPLQLYELLAALLSVAVVVVILRRHIAPGVAFVTFVGLLTTYRLVVLPLAQPRTGRIFDLVLYSLLILASAIAVIVRSGSTYAPVPRPSRERR